MGGVHGRIILQNTTIELVGKTKSLLSPTYNCAQGSAYLISYFLSRYISGLLHCTYCICFMAEIRFSLNVYFQLCTFEIIYANDPDKLNETLDSIMASCKKNGIEFNDILINVLTSWCLVNTIRDVDTKQAMVGDARPSLSTL